MLKMTEDIDKAVFIFQFTAIPSYSCSYTLCLNEPVYIIKVKEKGSSTEPLYDMYGHNISTTEELYLRGNYFKMARSKNISRKHFQIKKFDFIIPPDEVFVAFVEVTGYFPMNAKGYLAFYEQAK